LEKQRKNEEEIFYKEIQFWYNIYEASAKVCGFFKQMESKTGAKEPLKQIF
jgi:hypothetical protein